MEKVKKKYTLFTNKALALLIIPIVIESALSTSFGVIDGLMASYANGLGTDGSINVMYNYIQKV